MPKRPNLTRELRGEMIASYLRCRALRSHAWDLIPAGQHSRGSSLGGVVMLLRCVSCGTERADVFSPVTGDLMSRGYDYPPDYRDVEKHNIGWWRAQWWELDARVKENTVLVNPSSRSARQVTAKGNVSKLPVRKKSA